MEALRAAERVQRSAGLDNVEFLTPAEMTRLVPTLNTEDLLGGAFCPTDGFLHPLNILFGYLEAAQRLGVELRCGEEVTEMEVRHGAVRSVKTDRNRYPTRYVVNAAGAWAVPVAEMAGIRHLPVMPVRRQVAVTRPLNTLPDTLPMVIDCASGFHMRMRDHRALLLWANPNELPSYNDRFDPAFLDAISPLACHRIRCLNAVPIDTDICWAGLYEVTPDHHAIVGPTKEVDGFFLANGFSGHGVMHAPAIGQLVAEMLLDGYAHSLDISSLRPERFEEGKGNMEKAVL
jgi:sarcosine oxidase subunit beta